MTIVETTIRFANKGEEIKRVEKKNNKYTLASNLVDIYHTVFDENLSDTQKLDKITRITSGSYW